LHLLIDIRKVFLNHDNILIGAFGDEGNSLGFNPVEFGDDEDGVALV
jgi:hypothetical protein